MSRAVLSDSHRGVVLNTSIILSYYPLLCGDSNSCLRFIQSKSTPSEAITPRSPVTSVVNLLEGPHPSARLGPASVPIHHPNAKKTQHRFGSNLANLACSSEPASNSHCAERNKILMSILA